MSNQGDGNPPENNGGNQGETESQWSGGAQPWSGDQAGQPSWSTGQTGPNVGPTMNNPQNSYYDRFSEASGEGVVIPPAGGDDGGGHRGRILIGIAAALVVVIAAVAIFALTRGDSTPKQAQTQSPTSSLPPVTATTWVNPTLAVGARALKSGWVAQTADDNAAGVYDVPKSKDWKVDPSGWQAIWGSAESKDTLAVMHGPAEFGLGYCSSDKKDQTAIVGLSRVDKQDPATAGPNVAEQFAKVFTLDKNAVKVKGKQGKLSPAKKITVDQGTIPALEYTITATPGAPSACAKGKKYEIRTVTFSAGGQSYQLVAIRLLGVKPALSDSALDAIISTFRPS